MTSTHTELCASCRQPIVAEADKVICSVCATPHHAACWHLDGHCSTPGCAGEPVAPPPPAPYAPAPSSIPPPPPMGGFQSYNTSQVIAPSEIGLGAAVSAGWEAFNRNMGLLIGGLVVMMLVYLGMACLCIIPILGVIAFVLLVPALFGGGMRFFLNAVNSQRPDISDLFTGFREFGKWLMITVILVVVAFLLAIPQLIVNHLTGFSPGFIPHHNFLHPMTPMAIPAATPMSTSALGYGVSLLTSIACAFVFARWMFVFPAAAEGYGHLEAFGRSSQMTAGRRWLLFWILFVVKLLGVAGILACGIGILFTLPLALCAYVSLYNAVKVQAPEGAIPNY